LEHKVTTFTYLDTMRRFYRRKRLLRSLRRLGSMLEILNLCLWR
jgi:hypothetical protein